MYRYDISGEDLKIGEAKKIGKTIAVIVDKEWLGKRVVAIRDGKVLQYRDEDSVNKTRDKIDPEVLNAMCMYTMVRDIMEKEKHKDDFMSLPKQWLELLHKMREEGVPTANELWDRVRKIQNEQRDIMLEEIARLEKEVEKEKKGKEGKDE